MAVAGLEDRAQAAGSSRLGKRGEFSCQQRSVLPWAPLWCSSRSGQLWTICLGPDPLILTDEPGARAELRL